MLIPFSRIKKFINVLNMLNILLNVINMYYEKRETKN